MPKINSASIGGKSDSSPKKVAVHIPGCYCAQPRCAKTFATSAFAKHYRAQKKWKNADVLNQAEIYDAALCESPYQVLIRSCWSIWSRLPTVY